MVVVGGSIPPVPTSSGQKESSRMPVITLPDQSQRRYDQPVTIHAIAKDIGPRLAADAVAGLVNGQLVDVSHQINDDASIKILTDRDPEGIEVIRHSTAHLLAHAVKRLFPQAQVTIGPVIENGYYYDFAFERPFTPEDLTAIEAKMRELAAENITVMRKTMARDEAIQFFRGLGEEYKAKIIADIPANEVLSLYQQGDFTDLCRGPHVASTGQLKAFRLTKLAGAYWRGDSKNEMLQRIYGTAWRDEKTLVAYLDQIAEAEKRDHRKIGKQLDLFHLQEEAPGMPFWHAHGLVIYHEIEHYIRDLLSRNGYEEVRTPTILERSFWERSGHWDKFAKEMFVCTVEEREFALKPMNCPGHIQIFNLGLKSYRDLPLRIAEFGSCFRNEPSGALHGLMRCRNFVQDDAHIFCRQDQVQSEVGKLIDLVFEVYRVFGFTDVSMKLSTRPEQRVGDDAVWDIAEKALADALDAKGLQWELCPGEGAFYGPKIEFALHDCLNRVWQCGTVQLDFNFPVRLGANYIAEDSSRQIPIMIHRALLGSLERFIGILLEHYAGKLPLWLAPVQAVILNITDRQAEKCQEIAELLQKSQIRAELDLRNEKIGFKIREHTLRRVPYFIVLGDQELAAGQCRVRALDGQDLGLFAIDAFIERLRGEIHSKK
jgi:threonyl-tRNA synthetase